LSYDLLSTSPLTTKRSSGVLALSPPRHSRQCFGTYARYARQRVARNADVYARCRSQRPKLPCMHATSSTLHRRIMADNRTLHTGTARYSVAGRTLASTNLNLALTIRFVTLSTRNTTSDMMLETAPNRYAARLILILSLLLLLRLSTLRHAGLHPRSYRAQYHCRYSATERRLIAALLD